ncbi:efflux RND transporter permease subunit [Synechocystis sp. PCC 7339]|uniref:efflux RND transporter permease subunit n=1 Tax=Synechocystis sp. PCC 7339 TaxID=2782213 RepID=UPI001CBFA7C1|nr:efflux RND transporter permease subunit [Synechocystis sp. PCC 7339]UAJ73309.1 efflux RND transporter permease subunit [Synechocystis sp. PCC 7339]
MLLSISNVFIKNPVLTTVCTIVIILLGAIALPLLPLAKLPDMAPKQVQVTTNYVGSDAQTAVDNVTTVLERQINGTEQMIYMNSYTDNTGTSTINVYFPVEMDRNIAQVLVQNNVAIASSSLPEAVNRQGVTTQTQSPSVTIAYGVYSENNDQGKPIYDDVFVSNFVDRILLDEIKRIDGVGSAAIIGASQYAMRFWLDPDALAARDLSASDVLDAIRTQNVQVGVGGVNLPPVTDQQRFQINARALSRFTTPEEAEQIVVKVGEDGSLIRIKDVGRAAIGTQNYIQTALFNNAPAVAFVIYQLPGTNALDTANMVKEKMAELKPMFPPGLNAEVALDNTLFVTASLEEAVMTLVEAILLVILVIFIFLQNWRTTLIPALAIPVSLIGAMAFALAFGFSLNQLTLFGVILATGLVVDDGILVVEAIEVKLDQGMKPFQAALDAMGELTGAVISTSLVLMAVFIPVTFFPGTTGIVYKQFAVIMASAVAVSTFNAISFSPSMSAILMRRTQQTHGPLAWFFGLFNRSFDWIKERYGNIITMLLKVRLLAIPVYIASIALTAFVYNMTPTGFIPEEDQGYFFMLGNSPAGVSIEYTKDIISQATEIVAAREEVEHVLGMGGFSFLGNDSSKSLFFVKLKNWDERPGQKGSVFGLLAQINRELAQKIPDAQVFAVNAPPVDGLSSTGGLDFYVQNRGGIPLDSFLNYVQEFMGKLRQEPALDPRTVFTQFTFNAPLLEISVDREKANAQNVDISEVFSTIGTYMGSNYINQFVLEGRLYQVYAMADGEFRSNPRDIGRLYVRSRTGALVQLSNLVEVKQTTHPPILTHFNIYPAVDVQASPAAGYSTGQAMEAMERLSKELFPESIGYAWYGTGYEELQSAGAAPIIFGLAFIMVFLVLSAQYESYVDPAIIMMTVPLAILGAMGAILLRANFMVATNMVWPAVNNNVYAQVALVMLIGLASKNAILIVEFGNQAMDLGMKIPQAAAFAAKERMRPILMTAISGLVGFWPLVIASGAGAMSRWSLGTAIFGGYLISTVLSLFLVPVLYTIVKEAEARFLKGEKGEDGSNPPPPPEEDNGDPLTNPS